MGATSEKLRPRKDLVARLVAEAEARGVPTSLATHAAGITRRYLGQRADPCTDVGQRRWRAYFWAVVRRSALLERRDGGATTQLLVLTSMADDLRGAGYAPGRVYAELCRTYGTAVAPEALERFRPLPAA
jgi:hypothetical protein